MLNQMTGAFANCTVLGRNSNLSSRSASALRRVTHIVEELYAVLLELIHSSPDSCQQLTNLSMVTRVCCNVTHDSRRHGIISQLKNLGDIILDDSMYSNSSNLSDRIFARISRRQGVCMGNDVRKRISNCPQSKSDGQLSGTTWPMII